MKNYKRKLCSLCAVLSLVLSTIVGPGLFSATTFAATEKSSLGIIDIQPKSTGLFPITCVSANVNSGTFEVSSENTLANFILNLYDYNHQKLISSSEVTGNGKLVFDGQAIYPRYYGVSNNANESAKFNGNISVVGESPYLHCFETPSDSSSASSATSAAISSVFVALLAGVAALFS